MNNKEKLIKAFGAEVRDEDVDTFRGWIKRGRVVMQGQKSLCRLSRPVRVDEGTQFRAFAVFHVTQTKFIESEEKMT